MPHRDCTVSGHRATAPTRSLDCAATFPISTCPIISDQLLQRFRVGTTDGQVVAGIHLTMMLPADAKAAYGSLLHFISRERAPVPPRFEHRRRQETPYFKLDRPTLDGNLHTHLLSLLLPPATSPFGAEIRFVVA